MGQRPAPWAIGVLVVAISGVVALASSGSGLIQPPAGEDTRWLPLVRLAGLLALAGGIAGLVLYRRRLPPVSTRQADPTAAALSAAAVIMAALALTALLVQPAAEDPRLDFTARQMERNEELEDAMLEEEGGGVRRPRRPSRPMLPITNPGSGGSRGGTMPPIFVPETLLPDMDSSAASRMALKVLALLLLTAAYVAYRLFGRGGGQVTDGEPPVVPLPAAVAAMEASLLDISYDGTDPRRRIVTAYHRLVTAIADAGAPRQPQEAPHEFLHRALSPLGVEAEPMHRLAELYVLAQFSTRPVTESHATSAAEALEASLRSLRAAAVVGAALGGVEDARAPGGTSGGASATDRAAKDQERWP